MKNLTLFFLAAVLMSTKGAEEVIYRQVGETVSLQPPKGNLPGNYVYWYFGAVELAWRNGVGGQKVEVWQEHLSLNGDSLIIKNIQEEHFGTFSCTVKTSTDKIVATNMYQLLKINVSMTPPSPLLPGESFSLVCNAVSPQGRKKPEIHWLNPRGEKMRSAQGTLAVTATVQMSGHWTCVVTNDGPEHKAQVSVTVVDLSPAPLRPQYTSNSSPLTIPCSIPRSISWEKLKAKGIEGVSWQFFPKTGSRLISATPQRLFSLSLEDPLAWRADKDRGLSPAPDLKSGNLSLTRNRGNQEDSGDFVCSLKFKNGVILNRTVHVNVLQLMSFPGTDLISGQQVNMTCSLGRPLPSDLQVKWFSPQRSSLQSVTSDHLTIQEVGTEDSGKWRCELWQSDTRLTSTVITLKIEPRQNVWMLVIICSVTVIVILLLIVAFFLYRRRQLKMRHLRHRLCQCKHPKPKGFYRT